MLLNIGGFDSLELSGCLTDYGEISRSTLSTSKSRGLGGGGGGGEGKRVEMPAEF